MSGKGFLPLNLQEYLSLLDWTGRQTRTDKRGQIPAELSPIPVQDEVQYANTLEVIDRLMAVAKLTKGQALYLETLVVLVQAYEAEHHAIDTTGLTGLDSLKHLLEENQMNASDLARLLASIRAWGRKSSKASAR
jgi:HTH-type transcriptional regulator / antitoxin HigA